MTRRWRARLDITFPQLRALAQCRRVARWQRKTAIRRCKRRFAGLFVPVPIFSARRRPTWRTWKKPPSRRRTIGQATRMTSPDTWFMPPPPTPTAQQPLLSISGTRVRGLR
jgi:hypothetical protein